MKPTPRLLLNLLLFLAVGALAFASPPPARHSTKLIVINDDGFSGFYAGRYKDAADLPLTSNLMVACGETFRQDGEDIGKTFAREITLNNRSRQPVLLTDQSSGCTVKSPGPVTDQGTGNRFMQTEK